MYTKASTILISVVILLGVADVSQGTHQYPKVGNYFTSEARLEHCESLSKWDIVILNRNVHARRSEVMSTLRSMNPDIELLTYFPCAAVWAAYDTMDATARAYGRKVEACDWWLYDDKGNRVGDASSSWFINFTTKCPEDGDGKTVDEWLAEYIAEEIILGGPWDGILLDILFENPWWLNNTDWFEDPPAMLDIDRDGAADHPDSVYAWWRAGIVSFLDKLRQEIGPSYIVIGNGKHCLSDYLNGGIRENFPYMHGGWEENMLSDYGYFRLCRELLDYPINCSMILCFWDADDNTLYEPGWPASYERYLRYTLCSALLGDGYYFIRGRTFCTLWWEPYYDLDLGLPTSDAYLDSVWNQMYARYSPVWRRDFENATVYCNPYQEYISFDAGWLNPEDGLIKTHGVLSSVDIRILSKDGVARRFDQGDRYIPYKITVTNYSENAVFASVWANLSRQGTILVSGNQVEYLVGAQDTTVKDRMLRLPPTLAPGPYCLEVLIGGPNYTEVGCDTIMVTKIIDFEKEQVKDTGEIGDGNISIYPQPAISSGGNLNVEVNPGNRSGRFCSVRLYDVSGKLVTTAFEEEIHTVLSLDLDLTGKGGAPLAPGVYFLSVDLVDKTLTKKVVLLRR